MPRLSRTPSPSLSPTTPPTATTTNTTPKPPTMPPPSPPPVTYIPPLRDGACGTTPRSQQPLWPLLRHELTHTLRLLPTLCWALLMQGRPSSPAPAPTSAPASSWADAAGTVLHVLLACLEVGMVAVAVPLWCVLPGVVFAAWVVGCAAVVAGACWVLNWGGRERVVVCNNVADAGAEGEGWMMGQEGEDEKWLFLGGMGMR